MGFQFDNFEFFCVRLVCVYVCVATCACVRVRVSVRCQLRPERAARQKMDIFDVIDLGDEKNTFARIGDPQTQNRISAPQSDTTSAF